MVVKQVLKRPTGKQVLKRPSQRPPVAAGVVERECPESSFSRRCMNKDGNGHGPSKSRRLSLPKTHSGTYVWIDKKEDLGTVECFEACSGEKVRLYDPVVKVGDCGTDQPRSPGAGWRPVFQISYSSPAHSPSYTGVVDQVQWVRWMPPAEWRRLRRQCCCNWIRVAS